MRITKCQFNNFPLFTVRVTNNLTKVYKNRQRTKFLRKSMFKVDIVKKEEVKTTLLSGQKFKKYKCNVLNQSFSLVNSCYTFLFA